MKKFITMLLVASMLASTVVSAADSIFTGSIESNVVTKTETIGHDENGNSFIAKGSDEADEEVLISGGSTVIINMATVDVTVMEEEHKAVIEEAQAMLEESQKEIIENAQDLTKIFPELKTNGNGNTESGKDPNQQGNQKNYAVARLEAVVSYGEDAKQMEKIVEAKKELTIGLNEDFGYSKSSGDMIAIKFGDGNWQMVPQKDIKINESGHVTISFIPESVSYQIALIKEVKSEKQIKEEKEKKKNRFTKGYKALSGRKAAKK